MNNNIIISRSEYERVRECGVEPLLGWRLAHGLRVELQRERFGRGNTPAENERFYRWCWQHLPHRCEECLRPLAEYSAVHVSHVLTRGAHPDMAHDPRNVNILCATHHARWENGKRETMRIYESNQMLIRELKQEYNPKNQAK